MRSIYTFFNELRQDKGSIWVEEDRLKLFITKQDNKQEISDFIVQNKQEIISVLQENYVFSKEKFRNQVILRNHETVNFLLSPEQERLWFIEQYEGGTNAYYIPVLFEIGAQVDIKGIQYAIEQLVARHEILRTTITQGSNLNAIQQVHEEPPIIKQVEVSYEEYKKELTKDINVPFNLSTEYPMRTSVYTILDDNGLRQRRLLVNFHHIACDGWSVEIFTREMHAFYNAYIHANKDFEIPELKIQYKDYAWWKRESLKNSLLETQLAYWKNKLSGCQTLEITTDYVRPSHVDYKGSRHLFKMDKQLSKELRALSNRKGVTLNSVLLSGISILLKKYTGQDDIVLGSVNANRNNRQVEDLIGFFVNTQVNRVLLNNSQSFEELITQVHNDQISDTLHQDVPFEKLVEELGIERDMAKHPIFQVLFGVQSFVGKEMNESSLVLNPLELEDAYQVEKFDLSIFVDDSNEELLVKIGFATSLFKEETIKRLGRHFEYLLSQLVAEPATTHDKFSVLTSSEYNQIVYDWNDTDTDDFYNKTVHQAFQEQVERTPDAAALFFEGKQLTYKELDERTNQLARHIRKEYNKIYGRSLTPGTYIALCLERSMEMVIGILGVLKAGGAYVPMDIAYPKERFNYILEDTNAPLVLSQNDVFKNLKIDFPVSNIIDIDLHNDFYSTESIATLIEHTNFESIAYVIYTSGTTGNPKGVKIKHKSVNNLVRGKSQVLDITKNDNLIQFASYVFDASVSEIFPALSVGACLSVITNETRQDPKLLLDYLEEHKVNIATLPPTLLQSAEYRALKDLKTLVVAGESCPEETMQQWSKGRKLVNGYGPTENTVCAAMHTYSVGDINTTIGNPIPNVKLYVLDKNLTPVPLGVTGELYVGGISVAEGYLNLPELTSQRFINNPFATESDTKKRCTKLYKTGDLVCWLPNGTVKYLGRNDDQVKIRGYRIELGEIERVLTAINGISQSCVVVKESESEIGNRKYIAGYYIEEENVSLKEEEIFDELSNVLPEYMVPKFIVKMESFPVTINGKLDKRKLPDTGFQLNKKTYATPTNDIEKAFCAIWQELLDIEHIGITDDFFRIGGDSILSIQVSSRIRQLGYDCDVRDVFECKTIKKLAAHVAKKVTKIDVKSEQGILTGTFDLLPVQQWFVDKINAEIFTIPNHWNQSLLIKIPTTSIEIIKEVFEKLVAHHDVFRIKFLKETSTIWKQEYLPTVYVPEIQSLDVSTLSNSEVQEYLTAWQSEFDLEKGLLFQAGYLYGYDDGSTRLYLAMHHMIVDGVSWRILSEDILQLLAEKPLSSKGSSYRQWVNSVKKYAVENPSEKAYWSEQLENMPVYDLLTYGKVRSKAYIQFDKSRTNTLLKSATNAYNTEINDLLITALIYTLSDFNKNDTQYICLEGHGREFIDPSIDHSRTVGWFTSVFPIKLTLKETLKENIQSVKEYLRAIPNKGIGFGTFATQERVDFGHENLAPFSFNYLGQFDSNQGGEGWGEAGVQVDPKNMDHNLIDIVGKVSGGKLGFIVVSKFGEVATQEISKNFETHLNNIINHCTEVYEEKGTNYTPSDFETVTISQTLLDRLQEKTKHVGNEIVTILPANSLQQGFVYQSITKPENDFYRVQLLYDYLGNLNVDAYVKAWQLCIEQYPVLRTAFNWEEKLIQLVYQKGNLEYQVHDVSHLPTQKAKDEAIGLIQVEDRKKPFDLTEPTQVRLHIIKQSEDCYAIIKTDHHSVMDGWSGPIIMKNLHAYYDILNAGKEVDFEIDTGYIETQEYIAKNKEKAQEFWAQKLQSVEKANDINGLLTTPIRQNDHEKKKQTSTVAVEIEGAQYQQIKNFSQQHGITVNVLVQFIWHKLLQVYSGERQSMVGTVVSGREVPVEGIESSVGLFINTLPLLIDWDNDNTILLQLQEIQEQILALNAHSYADLVALQKEGERLFHSLVVFENYATPKGAFKHNPIIKVKHVHEGVDYPLCITSFEYLDVISLKFQYDENHLTKERANEHLSTLQYILNQVLEEPNKKHGEINVLNPQEYNKVVFDWNATEAYYEEDTTIHELFEEQVAKTPDAIALVYEGQELTYKDLSSRSNQLARHIRSVYKARTGKELETDTFIALCLDRSLELVIGILGVLKAGGAYVPIDPSYPKDRIDYILEDTGSELILTQKDLKAGMPLDKALYVDLSEDFYLHEDTSNPESISRSEDLAYIIYTSGTTGKPKGVMQAHGNVIRLFSATNHQFGFTNKDVWTLFHSYVFDFSVWELWGSLLYGGKLLVLSKEQTKDTELFSNVCSTYGVSVLNQTPSAFYRFIDIVTHSEALDLKLRYIIFGGEALNIKQLDPWWSYQIGNKLETKLVNMYGITETTVHVTYKQLIKEEGTQLNIGKPLSDLKAYVLDTNMQPVPVGVIGELFVGGAGLSRGYLNRPELTKERFISNPFASDLDIERGYTRLYKTGDLVRWLPDGNLEYIGRNDDQVKIRGYRIELGEIESSMNTIDGISRSCVLAKERVTESGVSNYLVGYYVLDKDSSSLTDDFILDSLHSVLPDYMIPSSLVKLENFPLTINGKLDKRLLPDPNFSSLDSYVAPTTDLENTICSIWQEVLGVDKVGITDNFFRIGGDSILSIQVSGRIRQLDYQCSVQDIFDCKTISKLALHLSKEITTVVKKEEGILKGSFGLLPVQEWFVDQVNTNKFLKPNHWNQSFLVKVPQLDLEVLSNAIEKLVSYHDILRVRYIKEATSWKQEYQSEIVIPKLQVIDVASLSSSEIHEAFTQWHTGFDLEQGALFQIGYVSGYKDGSCRLFFALHHMIVDAVSWRILVEDIQQLYSGKSLIKKQSSYRQWVTTVKEYSKLHSKESSYWLSNLKGKAALEAFTITPDRTQSRMRLDHDFTHNLLHTVGEAYHTEINDILLTALAFALTDITGHTAHNITLEGHGREFIDECIDHSRIVGWFTSMFPVHIELGTDIGKSIQTIKEQLRKIPNKGIGFGSFAISETTSYTQNDLPLISFNYLGQFDKGTKEQLDWQIIPGNSGLQTDHSNSDRNIININGLVNDGCLNFYVVTRLGEAITNKLNESLKYHLIQIITHCCEKLKTIGASYSPSDFQTVRLSQQLINNLQNEARSNQNSIEHIYPANSLQQGFIYHVISQPEDDAYRVQKLYDYKGNLDVEKYVEAWQYCIAQYPILRTAFNWEEELIQIVYKKGALQYTFYDLSNLNTQEEREKRIDAIQKEDRITGFDLTQPTLFRLHIFKHSENYFTILKNEHHSISDGWSLPVLMNSLESYYTQLLEGKEIDIQSDVAYLETQEYIAVQESTKNTYWDTVLKNVDGANNINGLLDIPIDLENYKQVQESKITSIEIKGEDYNRLKKLCKKEGITINIIVQFIWHKLLQVYCNNDYTVVGTTVSGRGLPIEGIENSVGLYINTLPLVIDWNTESSILSQLHAIQKSISELNVHSFTNLSSLQRKGEQLFHSLLVFENYPIPKESNLSASKSRIRKSIEKVNYPLGIIAYEYNNTLAIKLNYDGAHLQEAQAKLHLEKMEYVLHQILENPYTNCNKVLLLKEAEYSKIIHDWNTTNVYGEVNQTINDLFEKQVAKTPDAIALAYEGDELTYTELNAKSNQLARYIRDRYATLNGQSLEPDTLIALCTNRSLEMAIGILGILKAGGAYVPIDPMYPQDRIDFILEDTAVDLVISQEHLKEHLPSHNLILIDSNEEFYSQESVSNLTSFNTSNNLAYVIYTSGTTGKPKGVLVTHDSVTNLCNSLIHHFKLNEHTIASQMISVSFDASVSEILPTFLSGGKLTIVPDDIKNGGNIVAFLEENKVQHLTIPADLLEQLEKTELNDLKTIHVGGGVASATCFNRWSADKYLVNAYGPTETTVCSTLFNYQKGDSNTNIGKPIQNTQIYVLDAYMCPVPVGVKGELYIGGIGVSKGYLNRPELTTERFVDNPLASDLDIERGHTKLYKTGDLVKWLPNGEIEYMGRNDDQVKIRGYRIELKEIELAISGIEGVKQAVVITIDRAENDKRLIAFVVKEEEGNLSLFKLKKFLRKTLPEYMIPSSIEVIETMPITINGKVDKKALTKLVSSTRNEEFEYKEPKTEIEKKLASIWQKIIQIDKVGLNDTFFNLGGHSLLIIKSNNLIKKVFDIELPHNVYFSNTLEQISLEIEKQMSTKIVSV
ncbi:non-ribosomal peptide synthetase [Aquimarina pacifica]|uniref:non-ribosomal peptide synthetase n=1 Tax=Aquimarina pacifica TaxID=1296415 RepID=UPI000470D035|nr:non-ribosomal peptide synthetase [Aquimarina pacifica]